MRPAWGFLQHILLSWDRDRVNQQGLCQVRGSRRTFRGGTAAVNVDANSDGERAGRVWTRENGWLWRLGALGRDWLELG
jgi:hypothetical protein